jgi:hypothetical protein
MNEVALRSRIVGLVIAALLSVAGASATAAVSADDAQALMMDDGAEGYAVGALQDAQAGFGQANQGTFG